jgi:hypothetical protein
MDGYVLIACRLQLAVLTPYHRLRFEFAPNEFVTAVELVSLETQSNEAGYKEFIAVATTVDRGEDLAVRGTVRSNH